MMKFETYTGGLLETNAYLLHGRDGLLLIDAPEGAADWLGNRLKDPALLGHLLLTHGHYDHMIDAARIKKQTGCRVWIHPDSAPLLRNPQSMLAFSPYSSIDGVEPDGLLEEKEAVEWGGEAFRTLLCPGHCPGSICFFHPATGRLFGGDVLFAGGVGRWDLPGGSLEDLEHSIRTKLYNLPDDTTVLPGHGPATKIGVEKRNNPYVRAT